MSLLEYQPRRLTSYGDHLSPCFSASALETEMLRAIYNDFAADIAACANDDEWDACGLAQTLDPEGVKYAFACDRAEAVFAYWKPVVERINPRLVARMEKVKKRILEREEGKWQGN